MLNTENRYDRQISLWLLFCAGVIFAMIILGGVTRLTHSGLSMVEWKPLMGVIPPMSEQAWQETFDKYRQFPEYQKVNRGMSLDAFKSIFMYEYLHRVLGRLIGVLFLLPLLYFAWRGRIRQGLMPKLVLLFFLGGCQGLLGWYMVKSGLIDQPHVSQYRLTAHLGLARIIYCYLLWLLVDLLFPQQKSDAAGNATQKAALFLFALVAITIVSGGFVAGLKAGFAYNTFPKMGDQWLPPAGWMLQPGWRNLFENIATVQFDHRVLATLTLVSVLWFWVYTMKRSLPATARIGVHVLVLVAIAQVALGISTLLLHVPVALGVTHQAGALTLLTVSLFVIHQLRKQ